MLNVKSRRRVLQRKSMLMLYLEMKEGIRKVRGSGESSFSRPSSACEYWRRPALNAETDVPRHRKGLLLECGETNVLSRNVGDSQEDIDLRWNGMESGCLRAFFFNGNCNDEMGKANGTPSNVSYVQSKEGYDRAVKSNGDSSSVNCGSGSDIDDLTRFSIAFVVKPYSDGEGDEGRILDKVSFYVHAAEELNGYVRLGARVDYDAQDAYSLTERMVPINQRSEIVVTYDEGGDRMIHIYVDGAEAAYTAQQASQGSRVSDAANDLYLLNSASGTYCFDGEIDRLVLWDRILSGEEIRRLAGSGIAALWNFEDNCDDELGIHHGNATNVSYTSGQAGKAAVLLGTDSVIVVGRTLYIQNLKRFAVRARIKVPSKPSASIGIIAEKRYDEAQGWSFWVQFDDGNMRVLGQVTTAGQDAYSKSSTTLSYGEWHEVILSYDRHADNKVHLFVDGSEVAYETQVAGEGERDSEANCRLRIGNRAAGDASLMGYIDQLGIYRRPIKQSELGGELLNSSCGYRPILGPSGGNWDEVAVRDASLAMNEAQEVLCENGQYVMVYSGKGTSGGYQIGRAASSDGIHWTKGPCDGPVLSRGGAGEWDEESVTPATMLKMNDGTHRLYYVGRNNAGVCGLGLATSTDGINFTKHSGNPLVLASAWSGGGTDMAVGHVVKLSSGQWALMFERGISFAIYLGLSSDGMSWTPGNNGNPVMEGTAGSWDSNGVANPKLFELAAGKYLLGYNGNSGEGRWKIGFAWSTDLINWTKFSGNPVMDTGPAEWDAYRVESAFIAKQDVGTERVRMWYFGGPDGTYFRVGYALCRQVSMDIFDMIDVTGWEKYVEAELYEGRSIQLCESGGAARQYCQSKTLTQEEYIASMLAHANGRALGASDLEVYASGEITTNGCFETSLNGWTGYGANGGTGSAVRSTSITHGGSSGSCKVTHDNQVGSYYAYQDSTLIAGRQYKLSAWVYVPSGNVPSNYVQLREYWTGNFQNANLGITNQWQKLEFNFTAVSSGRCSIQLRVSTSEATDGIAYFDDVSLTEVNENKPTSYEALGGGVYHAWGRFAGGANQFRVGVEAKANMGFYVSLLTCAKAGTSKAAGPYPRSPIVNSTTGSATRQADSLAVAGTSNFDGEKGTLDVEFYPLFASSLPSSFELCLAHFHGGTGEMKLYRDSPNEIKFRMKGDGDEDAAAGTLVWNRGDRVRVRVVWNCQETLDGTNYMLMYGRVNEGTWAQVGACSSQPTAPSPDKTLYVGRAGTSGGYEANSFISWLRVYDRPLANPAW